MQKSGGFHDCLLFEVVLLDKGSVFVLELFAIVLNSTVIDLEVAECMKGPHQGDSVARF